MANKHAPLVTNYKQYDSLRRQGVSKKKARQLANASTNDDSSFGFNLNTRPAYEDWTKKDLYKKASELEIVGRSQMCKTDLIDAICHH